MNMIQLLIHQAYAHDQIYPHIHPHSQSTPVLDIILSLLWIGGIAGLSFLVIRVTRHLIQIRSRKPDAGNETDHAA